MTVFSRNFLHGVSQNTSDIESLSMGNYDLGIFFPSWDQRCLSILSAKNIFFNEVIFVRFNAVDEFGFREKHDPQILRFLEERCRKIHEINGESTDTENLEKKITRKIVEISSRCGQPLSVFYDLSTSPRFYALTVLAFMTLKGLYSKLCYFYAEGIYPKRSNDKSDFDNNFTKGAWKPVEIPYILGERRPNLRTTLLVSVGFEGAKTLQLVDGEEPDSVSVLFPGPGYEKEYNEVAYKFNKRLFKHYQISNSNVFKVHAGDAVGVWKKLENATFDKPESQNVIYLCCGTKPHALGMCIKAISSNYPIIKYRIPDEHPFVDIKPNGNFWLYSITDLSAS